MSKEINGKLVKIVIPVYNNNLKKNELISLRQCCSVLSNYPIIIIKPNLLNIDSLCQQFPQLETESFDDNYFKNVEGYNRLMLSSEFYQRFLDVQYILVYQLDAYVFKDELEFWCKQSYDYIGAPWIPRGRFWKEIRDIFNSLFGNSKRIVQRKIYYKVGNGGFSLRRTRSFYEITSKESDVIQAYLHPHNKKVDFLPEDIFWALELRRKNYSFSVPDYKKALLFAFDKYPETCFKITKTLPFGCHGWDRRKAFLFWKQYITIE